MDKKKKQERETFLLFSLGEHTKKKEPLRKGGSLFLSLGGTDQTARVTLPERKQRVQAYTRLGVPLTTALTRLMLGFQVRLERLWEWDTLMPKETSFPQKSHFAIFCTSLKERTRNLQRLEL